MRDLHQEKRHAVGIERRGFVYDFRNLNSEPIRKLLNEIRELYANIIYFSPFSCK